MILTMMKKTSNLFAMKSFGYYFGMVVAATMAFTACKKEITPEDEPQEITHTMTINLGKVDSKTAVVEGEESASYIWTLEDKPCFHVYESTTDADGKVSKIEGNVDKVTFSEDMTTASLSVSFTGIQSGPYTYSVVYAGTLNGNENPVIPAEQNPRLDNFDPTADVLISKPIVSETRLEELSMIMGRVSTINKMTLKGLEAGEKISKVEFTLDKGLSASYVLDSGNYSKNANKLTFTYTSVEALVGEGGTFPVYFVSAPVDKAAIVSVVVTTDKKVYTKSSTQSPNPFDGKTITFAVGVMKRFGMDMTGCGETITSSTDYVLVENASQILEGGEYLVVNKDGTQALGAYYTADKAYFQLTAVKTNEKTITITSEQVNKLTFESSTTDGQFYIRESNGNYLYYKGNDNAIFSGEKQDADSYLWSVGIDKISNIGNTARVLQYNNQNTRFACYQSTMEDVTLYVNLQSLIPALKTPTGILADAEGKTITVIWDGVENAESYKVTCGDIVETTGDTCYEFTVSEDGLYEISVVATTSDASFKDSAPATTTVCVGAAKKSKAFFSVNGQNSEGTEYEEGTTISFPANPSIAGVEFMGWTTSAIPTPQATAPVFVNTESTVMGTEDITFYAVFATVEKKPVTKTYGWETVSDSDWTISSSITRTNATTSYPANSGSCYGLLNSNSKITFAKKVKVTAFSYYCVRRTTNTNTSIIIQTSTDNSTWTDALSTQWDYFKSDSKTYKKIEKTWPGTEDVYVRLNITTAANRQLDDVSISYVEINYTDYCTNVVTLSSISVSGTPDKTQYTVGEAFDPAGLTVTGTYSNGESSTITEGISWSWTPPTFEESGNQSVSVTATVQSIKSAAYNVNVNVETIANTLAATDKSINVKTNLDVTSLFTTNSDAEITYTLVQNPSGAGTLNKTTFNKTTFSANAAGTYKVQASQAATTKYSAADAIATIEVTDAHSHSFGDTPVYTLSFSKLTTGTNYNTYVNAHTISVNDVYWDVFGNQSIGNYLCVGGKSLSNQDRTLTAKSSISNDKIGKVVLTHSGINNGSSSSITINSITVKTGTKVCKIVKPTVDTAGTLEFVLENEDFDASSTFQILINCTTSGNKNSYLTVNKIDFYSCSAE